MAFVKPCAARVNSFMEAGLEMIRLDPGSEWPKTAVYRSKVEMIRS